jgi:negative regulator of sigma E activity
MRKSRTRTPSSSTLGAALLLALGVALDARAASTPEPETVLGWALESPATTYRGRMMFTQWFGKQAHAEDIEVYHSGNRSRREFLSPDGTPSRVIVSDGDRQMVQSLKKGRVVSGDAVKSYEKVMAPEQERELLLKNYTLEVSGPEKIAGRACWVLQIDPRIPGKPSQKLWVDQQTHVVLENKRFIPKKSSAAMIRYTRFELIEALDDSLFAIGAATSAPNASKNLEPDFMTLEQLNQATGKEARLPEELAAGFRFESADFFTVGKQTVRHARYTDGLSVLSLFLTDKPVRLPKSERVSVASLPHASLRLSSAGKVLHWQRGRQHFTLLGDVTRDLLQRIASSLK